MWVKIHICQQSSAQQHWRNLKLAMWAVGPWTVGTQVAADVNQRVTVVRRQTRPIAANR